MTSTTILHNPNNPIITSKKRDFRAYGIDITFEDEALTPAGGSRPPRRKPGPGAW